MNRTCSLYRVIPLLVLLALPSTVAAQHFPGNAELTERIREFVESGRAAGIVLGVLNADGTRRIVHYGSAGPDTRPLGERSLFEIGSVTKVLTASLLADMVERGEVSFTDPVEKYLPDHVDVPSRHGKEITLLQLATHSSRLPRMPYRVEPPDPENPHADFTVEELYKFLNGSAVREYMGEGVEYSNLGYGLLGHALARAAGGTYQEVLEERILEPLGLDQTVFTARGELAPWMTKGHAVDGTVTNYFDFTEANAAAGDLVSTVGDMLTLLEANIGEPETLLEAVLRRTHVPRAEMEDVEVGLGWLVRRHGDREITWINGDTGGYHVALAFDPEKQAGVVLLSNSDSEDSQLASFVYDLLVPPSAAFDVAAETLRSYVGTYDLGPRTVTVTVERGWLFAEPEGRPKLRLYPESPSRFAMGSAASELKVVFERDDASAVVGLTVRRGGEVVQTAGKIE